ncbi:hypothetical protein GX645_02130 [Candidatus Sumerlaeota bacterium]|nr:N-acetylmuramoyl-L-alanine amidase [Candidatus Sumerlaeales bacterium]NLD61231.1 hypothetical protein [Candidatus Sumerlaeota bacterium]
MRIENFLCGALMSLCAMSFAAGDGELAVKPMLLPADCSTSRPATATIDRIVIHFSSDAKKNPDNPFDPEQNSRVMAEYKVSAHYMIDRDGTVYQLVPEANCAKHLGKDSSLLFDKVTSGVLGDRSVGIELLAVGSEKDMVPGIMTAEEYGAFKEKHPGFIGYTDAQYSSLDKLIAQISSRHPDIKRDRAHIVGHSDCAPDKRNEPGELFDWSRLGLAKYAPLQRERGYRGVNMNSYNIFWRNMRFEQIWKRLTELGPTSRTVVMLGDSITEGFPEKDIDGYTIVNEGINSDSIDHPTLPIGIIRRLDLIKLAHPEHIFFLIGINDICDNETPDDLEPQFIETYDALKTTFPNVKIHITPIFPVAKQYKHRNPVIDEMNVRIRRLAEERGFDIMDLTPLLKDSEGNMKEELTLDGVHVNNDTYKLWISAVSDKLKASEK